jgi:RNA polymerase sigma-70 factor, ECF subfamily
MPLSHDHAAGTPPMSASEAPADDGPLVARARGGDVEAFGALYRRHAPRVHALALRLEGDAVRAAELTQDVFVRAWDGLGAFRGDSAFGSWLHRITVNTAMMSARSARRRSARVVLAEDLAAPEQEAPVGSVAPRDVEGAIDLERAVRALPPGARRAFVLHEVEGFSHEEIGRLTGTAAGTVRAQLHRARRLLMEALER